MNSKRKQTQMERQSYDDLSYTNRYRQRSLRLSRPTRNTKHANALRDYAHSCARAYWQ